MRPQTRQANQTAATRRFMHIAAIAFIASIVTVPAKAGNKADLQKHINDTGAHVVRVEEHWKVRVAYPDPAKDLPQFSFVLTPGRGFDGPHMVLALNHQTEPAFSGGGVQLQAYDGPKLLAFQSKLHGKRLYEIDDEFEVRMAITVENGELKYEVFKVKSKSWGDNKGEKWMSLTMPTTMAHMNNYDADQTHIWTGAGAGVHTLEKVEVTKVRYTFSDGKDIDVDEYKTKIEYQPAVTYKSYEEYKASLSAYAY